MNRSLRSDRIKFRLLAIAVLAGLSLLWSQAEPWLNHKREQKASAYANEASLVLETDPDKAVTSLYIARALDPDNRAYVDLLADYLLRQNKPDEAIRVLARLKIGESGIRIAQIQQQLARHNDALNTLQKVGDTSDARVFQLMATSNLELNQLDPAVKSARKAFDLDGSNASALIVGLCYGVANQPSDLAVFIGSLSSPEAQGTLKKWSGSSTALAQELYSRRLYLSLASVLEGRLDSSEAYLLLAKAKKATGDSKEVQTEVIKLLGQGIDKDPANLGLRQLRLEVAARAGDKATVDLEKQRIDRIQSGRF